MNRRLVFLYVLSCMAASCLAAIVTGRTTDSAGEALPGVSVKLLALPDSATRNLVVTDAKGDFKISRVRPGNYLLHLSMIGMDDVSQPITVADTTRTLALGSITMQETATMLAETVVKGVKAAVVAKQDTMEFNADSYKVQTNATVEDLLKKLPGVEVSSDGSITSGGKSVSKILIDGKEFFSDDPTMATKNLPSDLVDKVQVVDRKSDLARLTGVDDGEEETVINLTVKRNMQNGWLGTITGGYGTDQRYDGSFNISTFTANNQISIVGGLNNINNLGFADSGRGNFRSFGPSGGITTAQRLGVNFNVGKDTDFRVGGNIFYSHSERDVHSKSHTLYQYENDVDQEQTSTTNSTDGGHNVRANLRLEWKIDEYNTLDFRPNVNYNHRDSWLDQSTLLAQSAGADINSQKSTRSNHGDSWNFDGRLIYNHNFKSHPGRSFSVNVNYRLSDTREHTTSWSQILYYMKQDTDEADELLYRYLDGHSWSNTLGGRLSWTEPLGDSKNGNFLQFAYRMNYQWTNADKYTYGLPLPEDPETFVMPDLDRLPTGVGADSYDPTLSNRFRNTFTNQELQIGYNKVHKNYNLTAGIVVSPSSTESNDLINTDRNIATRWVWNVAPFARLRYKFSKTMSLRADYRARSSSPSVAQLQPVADVSDPLNITQGNPDLKPSFAQTLHLNFNNYNQETQQSIFAMARVQYTMNNVVSKTITDRATGGRYTTYENADGSWSAFGMFMLNQPLRNRHWRVNGRLRGNYSRTPGYLNGDFNRSTNLSLSPSAGMTFSGDVFQFSVNPTYSFSRAASSLAAQPNRYTHSYGFNADAAIYLPFGLNLNTDLDFSKSSGYSAGYNTTQWFWNAQISYSVLHDKSLTFYVKAYDILGMKRNVSRSVSMGQISDSSYNDLTRYVMIGVTWKFNTLKNRNSNGNMGPDGMPMPGGGFRGPMGPPPGGGRPF